MFIADIHLKDLKEIADKPSSVMSSRGQRLINFKKYRDLSEKIDAFLWYKNVLVQPDVKDSSKRYLQAQLSDKSHSWNLSELNETAESLQASESQRSTTGLFKIPYYSFV